MIEINTFSDLIKYIKKTKLLTNETHELVVKDFLKSKFKDCWSEAWGIGFTRFPSLDKMQKEFDKWLDKNITND